MHPQKLMRERALSMISPEPEKRFMAVMTLRIVPMLDSVLPAVECAFELAR